MQRIFRTIALVVVSLGLTFGLVGVANAQIAMIDGPDQEVMRHNYITSHVHIKGTRWTYVTLRDGSEWAASPCRQEDSRNCWWNARVRGNGLGTSFLNLNGHYHYTR